MQHNSSSSSRGRQRSRLERTRARSNWWRHAVQCVTSFGSGASKLSPGRRDSERVVLKEQCFVATDIRSCDAQGGLPGQCRFMIRVLQSLEPICTFCTIKYVAHGFPKLLSQQHFVAFLVKTQDSCYVLQNDRCVAWNQVNCAKGQVSELTDGQLFYDIWWPVLRE